jgi:uncharacterized glyoxalase superfamily protein PhnB
MYALEYLEPTMKINPYLVFNGDCKAAFTFYAKCLQGQIEAMLTFGETRKPSLKRLGFLATPGLSATVNLPHR